MVFICCHQRSTMELNFSTSCSHCHSYHFNSSTNWPPLIRALFTISCRGRGRGHLSWSPGLQQSLYMEVGIETKTLHWNATMCVWRGGGIIKGFHRSRPRASTSLSAPFVRHHSFSAGGYGGKSWFLIQLLCKLNHNVINVTALFAQHLRCRR